MLSESTARFSQIFFFSLLALQFVEGAKHSTQLIMVIGASSPSNAQK